MTGIRTSLPHRLRSTHGVTLVEAAIVLSVVALLAAGIAPVTARTVQTARLTAASEDLDAIVTAVHNMVTEFTAFTPFTTTGLTGGTTVEMLVGDGDTAADGTDGADDWLAPVDIDGPGIVTDFLERHLITNVTASGGSYATGTPGWRGAYLNGPVDPDPWGNRYMVNVEWLRTTTSNDVFALSAGPDEATNTAFAVNGVTPGGDDLIAVIRRHAALTVP